MQDNCFILTKYLLKVLYVHKKYIIVMKFKMKREITEFM